MASTAQKKKQPRTTEQLRAAGYVDETVLRLARAKERGRQVQLRLSDKCVRRNVKGKVRRIAPNATIAVVEGIEIPLCEIEHMVEL